MHAPAFFLWFVPYWWSVNRILQANGIDVALYQELIWANEYDVKDDDGVTSAELTLLAAWEFAEDNMRGFGVQSNEYDLDGTTFRSGRTRRQITFN
jgi:hypothetical protein